MRAIDLSRPPLLDLTMPATRLSTDEVPAHRVGADLAAAPRAVEGRAEPASVREHAACWLAENQRALASSNAYVEQRGLPLARYRRF